VCVGSYREPDSTRVIGIKEINREKEMFSSRVDLSPGHHGAQT
jgi:hypothetical protein